MTESDKPVVENKLEEVMARDEKINTIFEEDDEDES